MFGKRSKPSGTESEELQFELEMDTTYPVPDLPQLNLTQLNLSSWPVAQEKKGLPTAPEPLLFTGPGVDKNLKIPADFFDQTPPKQSLREVERAWNALDFPSEALAFDPVEWRWYSHKKIISGADESTIAQVAKKP